MFCGILVIFLGCDNELLQEVVTDCATTNAPEGCQVFLIVDAERKAEGMAPLKWNNELSAAALGHARDMYEEDYFSHNSKDGRNFVDRVGETQYDASPTGENIAYGYTSAEAVMVGWMNSPGHRANILSQGSNEIGIGFYENYWVQVFGRRQ